MKPKAYHNFADNHGNTYSFSDHASFVKWWNGIGGMTLVHYLSPSLYRELRNAANNA